jgi:dihydrofolate reductase
MARLIYAAITSLDGYVEDEKGKFEWSMPDEDAG